VEQGSALLGRRPPVDDLYAFAAAFTRPAKDGGGKPSSLVDP
jgi:hypothetical protein